MSEEIEAKAEAVVELHLKEDDGKTFTFIDASQFEYPEATRHAIITVKAQIEELENWGDVQSLRSDTRILELKAILKNLEDRL